MIDFLKDYNVSETTIKELKRTQSTSFFFDLNCNEEECVKIINYLKSIGIKNIDELLLYETDLFFKNKNKIEQAFSKQNITELVELINQDYEEIEVIYEYL